MKDIKTLIETMKFPVREYSNFSFGKTFAERESLFSSIFNEVDQTVTQFKILPEYKEIFEWMTDSKGKGLALFGSVGRGKTVINSFIIPVLFYNKYNKVLTPQIAEKLTIESLKNKWAYCIDDIGTEEIVNDYGNKTDMVSYAINDAEHYLKPLFLTSNLTEKEMIQRYGIHLFDRIKRLCKIVVFTGKSLRN